MTRSFKVEIEVDEIYEMKARVPFRNFDQRNGEYTDYKVETRNFMSFNDACDWLIANPEAEIKEFVRVENKLTQLKLWAKKADL